MFRPPQGSTSRREVEPWGGLLRNPYKCVTVSPVDAEDKKKLDRVLALAEENNTYIRKMRKAQKTAGIFKTLYWLVIIAFMVGGFYFLQPYLNTLLNLYSGLGMKSGSDSSSSFKMPDAAQLQELIKNLKQ